MKVTVNQLKNAFATYHLPRLSEIPDLDLYMDQVILYVRKHFSLFPYSSAENFITPSMINNYVKSGLIPAPIGKKYGRRHIAYILAVFFLKQVFSLEEVKAFIYLQTKATSEAEAYEMFCDFLENELKNFDPEGSRSPLTLSTEAELSMFHAIKSIVNKLYSQSLMKNLILK